MTEHDFKSWIPEELGETSCHEHENFIVFITLYQDEAAVNPLEDSDCMGKILSSNRRHVNFDPEAWEKLKESPDAVVLSYFEHGRSFWMPHNAPKHQFGGDWNWDGVDNAGVWVPDQPLLDAAEQEKFQTMEERREWMEKQADAACKAYNAWVNGEVYGYSVEIFYSKHSTHGELYDQLSDYRFEDHIEHDSCCGYIGSDWEYMVEQIIGAIKQGLGIEEDEEDELETAPEKST